MKDKTPTPTLEQKVEQYELFLHNINMMLISGSIPPEILQGGIILPVRYT
jgi:hypothetical protein